MSRYDITHDQGDLRKSLRKDILQVLLDAGKALRPKQIQYHLGSDLNQSVTLEEIEATLRWMVFQPLMDDYRVHITHNNVYGALPVYGIVTLREHKLLR
jgi:hypothetical protein